MLLYLLYMSYNYKILSFLILFALGFLFLHSELDLFSPEHHIHIEHDFCDIVDNAKTENLSIAKLKISTINIPIVFLDLPIDLSYGYYLTKIINHHNKQNLYLDISILNSSLLI